MTDKTMTSDKADSDRAKFEAEFIRRGLGELHFVRHFNNPDDYLIEHIQNKWIGWQAATASRDAEWRAAWKSESAADLMRLLGVDSTGPRASGGAS